jgi:hypothetical protein
MKRQRQSLEMRLQPADLGPMLGSGVVKPAESQAARRAEVA